MAQIATPNRADLSFQPLSTSRRFINLTGRVYGRLTVLGYAGTYGNRTYWFCQCKCGTVKKYEGQSLGRGARSCGCWNKELISVRPITNGEQVGGRPTPEYRSYHCAKTRCNNPNSTSYERYGGRGIKFRFTSFEQFLAEIGRKPTPRHSINRINNNGHYEPGNVEWATPEQQTYNRRKRKSQRQ